MNAKERKELIASKTLLIVLGVMGLGVVIWLAWIRPAPQPKNTAVNNANEQSAQEEITQETGTPPSAATQYLTISEWKVRAPLTSETYDLVYTYHPLDGDSVTFTFTRLQKVGICDPSVGVAMTRSTTQNQPPFNIDNPEPVAQVDNYYYYVAVAGEPCTTVATDAQKQVANQINNGDLNAAVRAVLAKLEDS